jgi:hypothetical protein
MPKVWDGRVGVLGERRDGGGGGEGASSVVGGCWPATMTFPSLVDCSTKIVNDLHDNTGVRVRKKKSIRARTP